VKEVVLRIFIGFKNSSPWPGFNPQSLGPVASTLTTTATAVDATESEILKREVQM
jgi:hypothetical protein